MRKLSTDLIKSGSFQGTFTGSFTGSITGNANSSVTASYALTSNSSNTSVTASYALTSSISNNSNTSSFSNLSFTSISSSLAVSSSYAENAVARIVTGSGVLTTNAFDDINVQNTYNTIITALKAQEGSGLSRYNVINGFIDDFNDSSGIFNSSSFFFSSSGDYGSKGYFTSQPPTGPVLSSSLFTKFVQCDLDVENVTTIVLAEPLSSSFSLNNNFKLFVTRDSGSSYFESTLVTGSVYSSSINVYKTNKTFSIGTSGSIIGVCFSSSISPVRIYAVGVVGSKSLRNTTLSTVGQVGISYITSSGNGVSSSFIVSDSTFNDTNTLVFVSGSSMVSNIDFNINDGNLLFTVPPPTNQKISLVKFTSLAAESNPNTAVMDYQNISATLSQSVLTLSQNVTIPKNLIVSINGLIKNLNDDYSISGSKFLVLNKPPASLDNISIRYVNAITNADILSQRYVANGISSSYSLSSSLNTVNSLLISVNGILQTPSLHYYINSSSLYDSVVLDEAPKSGSIIEIRKIQYASPYSTLTSSFSTTASYALNADIYLTASNVNQSIAYSVSQSQEFVVTTAQLTSNYWSANIIEEWDSGSFVLDSNYSNVKLLLHFSGSNRSSRFIDNSLNNYTASISGSPVISTNESKFNNSSLFLSNNSFLYYSQSLLPLSSNFTVESWVQPISYVNQPAIWSQGNGYPFSANRLQLYLNTSGNVIVQYGMSNIITSSLLVPLSKWTNITFVKSSSIQYLFIDGTLTNTGSISTLETEAFTIGNNYSLGSQYFNGYIDEFRITNSARYSSSFTVSDIEFSNANTASQSATKYFASIGGLNDSYVDYGVEKLSDTSIKVKKLSKTTQPLSGSSYLNPTVDRVYVNIIDNTKALVQTLTAVYASTANSASYANTASYANIASYATYTLTSSLLAITSSISASYADTSSYAVTSSYALNGGGSGQSFHPFLFSGG